MPRKSLPVEIKRVRSFVVVLHVDTEEDIYAKLCEKLEEVESLVNEKRKLQNAVIYRIIDENPYLESSWREESPKRVAFFRWMNNDADKWNTFNLKLFNLNHDFQLCIEKFGWEDTKSEESSEIITRLLKCNVNMEEEFKMFENEAYSKAKKLWEIRDAEWIGNKQLLNKHNDNHRSLAEVKRFYDRELADNNRLGLKSMNERLFKQFPNGPVETRDYANCKYCVEERDEEERKRKTIEEEVERERKRQEEYEEEKKAELKNKDALICSACSFCTYNDALFDAHLESKEHAKMELLEKLYCKHCEFRGRNQNEFMLHTLSKKHRLAVGELKSDNDDPKEHKEHKCELCEYSTYNKSNFDKHKLTKSHIDKHK
jgi:hypothetical protein